MAVSPFDSQLDGPLLGDPAVAALFDDRARIRAMLRAEAALARAQAGIGLVPEAAAGRIEAAAGSLAPDPAELGAAAARDGVPVPALVGALRAALDPEAAAWVHWGATSQDIIDTALVLALRDACEQIDARCEAVLGRLVGLARAHRDTLMVARTRTQPAVPTSFGLKAAGWAEPLLAERARLRALRPTVLRAQLGGAGGSLGVLGARAPEVIDAFAVELDLAAPTLPWHAQRESLVALGDALARLAGALAKMGQDVALLAQAEVGELGSGTGGSSTMPHKANPVGAETLVALGRTAASAAGGLHQAQVHAHERDGAAWMQEWFYLPQLCCAAAGALARAEGVLADLAVDRGRMREHATGGLGLPLAEAATFALAQHVPRPDAQARVGAACRKATAEQRHLLAVLAEAEEAPVDWQGLADPAALLGGAGALVDRFLAHAEAALRAPAD